MSKSNYFENAWLKLIFNAVGIPGLAQDGVAPNTHLFVAMHVGDPGEIGSQPTNETTYTGYTRVAVPRTPAGWTVSGSVVSPTADLTFPVCVGLPGAPLTHFSVGMSNGGAGEILYKGTLTPNVPTAVGVIPRLTVGTNINED